MICTRSSHLRRGSEAAHGAKSVDHPRTLFRLGTRTNA